MPHHNAQAITVVAGIVWHGNTFLAVQRPEGKPMAGFWEFPGGKVELGETLDQALIREFEEELDLTPKEFTFWQEKRHAYEHLAVHLHFFHIWAFSGIPKPLEGHLIEWLGPTDALKKPFLEADADIVQALIQKQHQTADSTAI